MNVPELSYPLENDAHIHTETAVTLGSSAQLTVAIEAATEAGCNEIHGPQRSNEDSLAVTQLGAVLLAAVFDGASSQQPIPELKGVSGARFAAHRLKAHLEGVPEDFDTSNVLPWLNLQIRGDLEQFASVSYEDLNTLPTATATIAQLDPDQNKLTVWHVGDSFALAAMTDGTVRLLTNDLHRPYDEAVFKLMRGIAAEKGITPRETRKDPRVREAIMHMFQTTRNRPDGTGEGMVNGDPHMEQYIHTSVVTLSEVRGVFIGSDGVVPPNWDIQKQTDMQRLILKVSKAGVAGLMAYTRTQLDADPDRYYLRYKHADDATGLWLRRLP